MLMLCYKDFNFFQQNRKFPKPFVPHQQSIPNVIAKKKNKGSRTLSTEDDDEGDDDDDFFTV